MRTSQIIPALSLLVPSLALAGDISIEVTGTVTVDTYQFGPFQALQIGDALTVAFDVDYPGTLTTPQLADYNIDLSTFAMSRSGTPIAGAPNGPRALTIEDDSAAGVDRFAFGGALTNGDFFNCSFTALSSLFAGVDLATFVGTYDIASISVMDDMRASGAGGFMRFRVDTLVISSDFVGMAYCPGVANTTGSPGVLVGGGSATVANNDLTLEVSGLPAQVFTLFVTGQTQGFVMNPGGSQGNLCLGGAIGRYTGPGHIQAATMAGTVSLALDLAQTPTPTTLVSVTAGETWFFQGWYRDTVGGMPASNFTNGLEVLFL